jgi:uncharacterized protein (DUF2461 family)
MPSPESLRLLRQNISTNESAFRATFERKRISRLMGELKGEQATRVPRGFRPDDPAADLLRHKRFILYTTLSSEIATTPALLREISDRFKAMTPFVEFLDRPLLRKDKFSDAGR